MSSEFTYNTPQMFNVITGDSRTIAFVDPDRGWMRTREEAQGVARVWAKKNPNRTCTLVSTRVHVTFSQPETGRFIIDEVKE